MDTQLDQYKNINLNTLYPLKVRSLFGPYTLGPMKLILFKENQIKVSLPQTTFDDLQPCWFPEVTMGVLVVRLYKRPVNPCPGDNGREDSSG